MMEYQKLIKFLNNASIQQSKFTAKIRLKEKISQERHIMPIVTLGWKPQCESLVYVIIVMHKNLLKEE